MIKEKIKPTETFSFSPVQYDDVVKKIKNLDASKSSQQSDIPTKIRKYNSNYFGRYFHENINFCLVNSCLPSDLKIADVTPAYKKTQKIPKITIDLSVFYLISPKYTNAVYMIKWKYILKMFCLLINVAFAKDLVLNTV